ncbi:MAG: methyltransferase family protein [Promethearchaeota archaeon]
MAGKKIIILPLLIIPVIIVSLTSLFYFDILPLIIPPSNILSTVSFLFPILGVFLMEILGLILVYQMWSQRDRLKAKFGNLAYQKILYVGLIGVTIIIITAIHNVVFIFVQKNLSWSNVLYSLFIFPLTSYIPTSVDVFLFIRMIIGIGCFIIGVSIMIRSVFTFGIDYMMVLYLYFPEESEIQNHKIYSILRHPAYAAAIVISLGGMILQLNLYSISFFILIYLTFYFHIHYVEEKELIERFGPSYMDYKKKVRAFFVRIKDFGKLLAFVIGKNKS